VTDGDELAKPRLVRRIDVNDGIVLNVGARADNYAIEIPAQNSAVPYTRFLHVTSPMTVAPGTTQAVG
jgi:hypothetical protein